MLGKTKIRIDEGKEIACGSYTRREAAQTITEGARNLHSTTLGEREPEAQMTQKMLRGEMGTRYSWEIEEGLAKIDVQDSAKRGDSIKDLITKLGVAEKARLVEKVQSVLEELVTNAIFHSYRNEDGFRKYDRTKEVVLQEEETVSVNFARGEEGIFLQVIDRGGELTFERLRSCLERCYEKKDDQMESKTSGAGLGLYIVFETVTHLKIEVTEGKQTSVTCLISEKRPKGSERFSFNFYEKE